LINKPTYQKKLPNAEIYIYIRGLCFFDTFYASTYMQLSSNINDNKVHPRFRILHNQPFLLT